MSFKDLDIKTEYRSLQEDVVKEFYLPLMKEAKLYQRAVGFFSSSALAQYAVGIPKLIQNGGKIEMVASPRLSEEDIDAIKKGYELRKDVVERVLINSLTSPANVYEEERLNLLVNYIADEKLDIKIALLEKNNEIGIYHEKLGLMYDKEENVVAFTGSMNETANGMEINYETLDVFCSWKDAENRVESKVEAFATIWKNRDPSISIVEFPKVREELFKKYKKEKLNYFIDEDEFGKDKIEEAERKVLKIVGASIPSHIHLHDYQIEAIDTWENHNYRGIFDMATGTGKTYTALGALARICENKDSRLAVVIVCPYQHLVEQWVEDLQQFYVSPIIGHSASKQRDYKRRLKNAIFDYNLGVKKFICFICTNASYATSDIQEMIGNIKGETLLIVDEAHNFGSQNLAKTLDRDYTYRLALSATLDRHNDEEGTQKLYDFFGKKCIEYTLDRAIEEKKLTPYYYYPTLIYLADDELERYNQISREIAKCVMIGKNGKSKLSERGKNLAIKRARIIAGAVGKVSKLIELMEDYRDDKHMLVYCGATTLFAEDTDVNEDIRQIDYISRKLGLDLHMNVAQFTSRENMDQRSTIKKQFEQGEELQALIAIKCLDEGVNIPMIKTAFILASTTNPKEYIQRRGRVLRLYPGKQYAKIYDFVTLPRRLSEVTSHSKEEIVYDYGLVKNELLRIEEFKRLALNSYDSNELIEEIKDAYGLYETEFTFEDIVE